MEEEEEEDDEWINQVTLVTFEWYITPLDELVVVKITQGTTSTRSVEHILRDAHLLGGIKGDAHDPVGDNAGHRRHAGSGVEPLEKRKEVVADVVSDGLAQRRDVLRPVPVGGGQAVGDGLEAEVVEALDGVGAAGGYEAAVVVLGVDEGDVEALGVEELGQGEDGSDVALGRKGNSDEVRLLSG